MKLLEVGITTFNSKTNLFDNHKCFFELIVIKNSKFQIIRTAETSDETYNKAVEWGKAAGKVTITCKDTPGFVVNRLLVPFMGEAFKMLERGLDFKLHDILVTPEKEKYVRIISFVYVHCR